MDFGSGVGGVVVDTIGVIFISVLQETYRRRASKRSEMYRRRITVTVVVVGIVSIFTVYHIMYIP